jgi:hypothetical protein
MNISFSKEKRKKSKHLIFFKNETKDKNNLKIQ